MDPLEQPEVARRIRAAMRYGKVSRAQAASLLGVSPDHLDRYTSGRSDYKPQIDRLWDLARRAGLSPNWFSADLSRLDEIVPGGMPVFAKQDQAEIDAARERLAAAEREKAERSRERPEDAPDTKRARRHPKDGAT